MILFRLIFLRERDLKMKLSLSQVGLELMILLFHSGQDYRCAPVQHHAQGFFLFESHCIAQTGFKFLGSSNPLASAF